MRRRIWKDGDVDVVQAMGIGFEVLQRIGNAMSAYGGRRNDIRHILSSDDDWVVHRIARVIMVEKLFAWCSDLFFESYDIDDTTPRAELIRRAGLAFPYTVPHPDEPWVSHRKRVHCRIMQAKTDVTKELADQILPSVGCEAACFSAYISALVQFPQLRELEGFCAMREMLWRQGKGDARLGYPIVERNALGHLELGLIDPNCPTIPRGALLLVSSR